MCSLLATSSQNSSLEACLVLWILGWGGGWGVELQLVFYICANSPVFGEKLHLYYTCGLPSAVP